MEEEGQRLQARCSSGGYEDSAVAPPRVFALAPNISSSQIDQLTFARCPMYEVFAMARCFLRYSALLASAGSWQPAAATHGAGRARGEGVRKVVPPIQHTLLVQRSATAVMRHARPAESNSTAPHRPGSVLLCSALHWPALGPAVDVALNRGMAWPVQHDGHCEVWSENSGTDRTQMHSNSHIWACLRATSRIEGGQDRPVVSLSVGLRICAAAVV